MTEVPFKIILMLNHLSEQKVNIITFMKAGFIAGMNLRCISFQPGVAGSEV